MSKGRKWYKKEEYNQPLEPFDPGDGSLIEVAKDPDEQHPDALLITRVWPSNHVTKVRKVPPSKFSQALYLSIEGDIQIHQPTPRDGIAEILTSGRAPQTRTSSVPGNKPGETFDSATNQHFETRERFNQYYKENQLEKVPANDSSLMRGKPSGGNYGGQAQQFDPLKGPPVPPQFQGVKFHTSQ